MEQKQTNKGNRIRTEDNRRRSRFFKSLFLVMAVLILVLDLIFILLPDKELSDAENRTLEQFPKLNFTTLTNGKFESRFDSYVADQFPARDAWVRMKSTVDRFAGKTENRNIYLGKDGYLIQNYLLPSEEAYAEKMEEIRSFADSHKDLKLAALIAPTALSVMKDFLPANAPAADEDEYLDRLKEDFTEAGFRFVDTRDALKEAAQEEQVYYRTDHHWTTFGAYAAYQALGEALMLPGIHTNYEHRLVTDSFSGTLTATSGFRGRETDQIYVFLPDPAADYSVFYVEEGKRTATFYESDNLELRDKYTVFFGGNYPEVKIETSRDSKDVLLVLKDSYANCLVPFLAGDYSKIIMIDPRYYTGDLDGLIAAEKVTDVLYLFNAETFIE